VIIFQILAEFFISKGKKKIIQDMEVIEEMRQEIIRLQNVL